MDAQRIAQMLVERGLMEFNEADSIRQEAQEKQRPFAEIALKKKAVDKDELYTVLADEMGVPYVDLENYMFDNAVVELITPELAREFHVFPLFKINDVLTVAMSEPDNLMALDQIGSHANLMVEACLSPHQDITGMVNVHYGSGPSEAEQLIAEIGQVSHEGVEGLQALEEYGGESPITKLVNLILSQGVRDGASDIHIEPEEDMLRIRFRIDGVLHEIPSPPKNLELAIISRIKVLSNLDIAETRVPQDGHFQIEVDSKRVDIRVSTLPTVHGENVVMRLLDTSSVLVGLEEMGFGPDSLAIYEELILHPYGVILSTGPTGSGKTTTLYSALMRINSIDRNIITVEDPVEYRLSLIRQVQVNPKAGITFVNGLRSILRQDPDVIMVGEIRDVETAIIAIQAALTGHLVFSTLHTNDAASAIARLENMGVEPFLISAALTGVMAQRLVRKICEHCRESYEPTPAVIEQLGLGKGRKKVVLYKGKGCQRCKGTGYKGRTGIFELLVMNDSLRELVIQQASTIAVRDSARESGMKLLREDGIAKALQGITTIEEVTRVTEERVDVKPVEVDHPVEIKPVAPAVGESPVRMPEKIVPAKPVSEDDIEEYKKKIASWLARQ